MAFLTSDEEDLLRELLANQYLRQHRGAGTRSLRQ